MKGYQRSIAFTLGRYAVQEKEPSRKQAIQGLRIVNESKNLGYEVKDFDENIIKQFLELFDS